MSVSLSPSDLDAIRQLLKIVTENNLSELTLTLRDGISITIRSASFEPPAQHHQALPELRADGVHGARQLLPEPATAPIQTSARRGAPVESPMVGIFYQSPAPGEASFVNVGDTIRIGQPIGLIEAMKVFSEILSEVSGRVAEIAVGNGVLVQQGQPLMYLEPA